MWVIGIAGGSGSGKTTIVERIQTDPLIDSIAFLPHDAYYRNLVDMPDSIRESQNWDHPDSLDSDLFVQHIDQLGRGQPVDRPIYNFKQHTRAEASIRVEPRPVLLVEGILILALSAIRERIDLRVFVDTPADLRILRRLHRDLRERNRTIEDVTEQYQSTARPMHETLVEPSRMHAHLIVPWTFHNDLAVEMLLTRIRAVIG